MADGRHFENHIIAILSLQPCVRFWWNLAWWRILAPCRGPSVKISNVWKSKMAASPMLKITKIAISPKRFDRFLRNLVWLFKKVLLTSEIIKNWISKIQDGEQLPFWKPLNHHISAYNRHDEIVVCVVSGVVVWIGQLLLTCSDFKFSVNDSLELSGIQFTPPKRTRQRQESFVVSDMAVWIDCFSLTRFEQRQWPRNGSIRSVRPQKNEQTTLVGEVAESKVPLLRAEASGTPALRCGTVAVLSSTESDELVPPVF